MKKFFAGALSCILALSTVTFTYAADTKDNFLAALEATAAQVKKENDMIIAADPTAEVLKALSQKDTEIGLNFKINSFESAYPDEVTAALDRMSFSFLQNQALKPKKSLTNFQLLLPKELINSARDLDLNVDLYVDEDKLGIRMPAISDSFYYVNISDLPELGEKLGIDGSDLPMFVALLKSLPDMTSSLALDVSKYQNVLDPYKEIFVNALSNGTFASLRGEEMVSKGTTFETEKMSVTLTATQVNRLLSNIANQLQDDELIYELYSTVYGGMTPIYASLLPSEYEGDFAAYLIATLCEGLRSINVENDFTYTICVNENNLIVSHRLNFTTSDQGSYKFRFDTKGIDYLYNDVFLEFEEHNTYWAYTSGIRVYLVGDYIPKNGVTDIQMKFEPYSIYQNSDEYGNLTGEQEEYSSDAFIMDYKWDTNKTVNNFSISMYTEPSDDYEDFSIDMLSEEEFNYYTSGLSYEEYLYGVETNQDPLNNLYGSYTFLDADVFEFYISDLKSTTYDEYVEQLTYISSYATQSDYEFRIDLLGSVTANPVQNRIAMNFNSIRIEMPYTGVIDMGLKMNFGPGASSKITMNNIKNVMEMDSFTAELLKLQSLFY